MVLTAEPFSSFTVNQGFIIILKKWSTVDGHLILMLKNTLILKKTVFALSIHGRAEVPTPEASWAKAISLAAAMKSLEAKRSYIYLKSLFTLFLKFQSSL